MNVRGKIAKGLCSRSLRGLIDVHAVRPNLQANMNSLPLVVRLCSMGVRRSLNIFRADSLICGAGGFTIRGRASHQRGEARLDAVPGRYQLLAAAGALFGGPGV